MSVRGAVFFLYFALVFLIGWYALRRTGDESDYWIAGGKLGWLVGGGTLAATQTSAGTFIGAVGLTYTVGWSAGWLVLAIPLGYFFMAAVLAPRFTRVRKLTLPDYIETRYASPAARAVAAAIILFATVFYIQAQVVAGGLVANIVFGLSPRHGMILFTAVLIAYTVVGGMIAVVYTDLLQVAIMTVGALVAVPMALHHLGGLPELLAYVEAVKPTTFTWEGMPATLLFTLGLAFFLGAVATPERLIRLYAMRDMHEIRRGILLASVLQTGINLLVGVLALAAIVLFPRLTTGDLAMPVVARAVLPTFVGTLMLAAITAAMMSTVDSLLIVAGSALSEDIYRNLFAPSASRERRLRIARLGIVVVGVVPLVITLLGVGQGELVQFIVLLFTSLMASSFFVPVVGGVLWRRANREGALAGMLGGLAAAVGWELLGPAETVDPVVPGFLASAVLYLGVSLAAPPPPREAVAPFFGAGEAGAVPEPTT